MVREIMFGTKYTHAKQVLSHKTVLTYLRAHDLPNIVTDGTYLTVSDTFAIALGRQFRKDIHKWKLKFSDKFDCDDYATTYWNIARKMFASNSKDISCQSIAVGCLSYRKTINEYHMVNWYINEACEVVFIEPQLVNEWGSGKFEFTETDWGNIRYVLC